MADWAGLLSSKRSSKVPPLDQEFADFRRSVWSKQHNGHMFRLGKFYLATAESLRVLRAVIGRTCVAQCHLKEAADWAIWLINEHTHILAPLFPQRLIHSPCPLTFRHTHSDSNPSTGFHSLSLPRTLRTQHHHIKARDSHLLDLPQLSTPQIDTALLSESCLFVIRNQIEPSRGTTIESRS